MRCSECDEYINLTGRDLHEVHIYTLVQALADRLKQEAPQVRARVLAAIGEDRVSDVPLIPGLGGDWGARL